MASEFYNFPCFPKSVPDLEQQLANDKKADPPGKYKILEDVKDWTANLGFPGYVNAAISEVFREGIIPMMFAQAAKGDLRPKDALNEADKKAQAIFKKWRAEGVI